MAKLTQVDLTTHRLIANLCREMAEELWEELMRNNKVFEHNKQHYGEFIRRMAPALRPEAVRTLSMMLGRLDVPEHEKALIHEALIMDRSVPEGVTTVVPR